jgi:hypothetical protein
MIRMRKPPYEQTGEKVNYEQQNLTWKKNNDVIIQFVSANSSQSEAKIKILVANQFKYQLHINFHRKIVSDLKVCPFYCEICTLIFRDVMSSISGTFGHY